MRDKGIRDENVERTGEDEIDAEAIREALAAHTFVVAGYLFGSCVRGTARPDSDLDIAVPLAEDAPKGLALANEMARLAADIQRIQPFPHVDLVLLNHQGILFQHTVLQDGILLYEKDGAARRRFAWRVIREYCEFEPTLRFMKKYHRRYR